MASKNPWIPERLYRYILEVSSREPEVLARLRVETSTHPRASMQIPPEQGQFMALLVELIDARKTIEVGVFTGYSSTAVALALPRDGRIVACDINEDFAHIARRVWKEAGVEHKIDFRLGPALGTLDALIAAGERDTFDFAFIDADKPNYLNYYERILVLLRPGGLLAIDNVLWSGDVADPAVNDPDTEALRALNRRLHHDQRVTLSMVPIADGLTLARKRG